MSITYNKQFLSLINDLALINKSVIIENKGDTVKISRSNPAQTIFYILTTKAENFQFSDDKIAFYDYSEFYRLLNVFDTPDLSISENKVTISKDKSRIKYIISDPETIQRGPEGVDFGECVVKFDLDSTDFKNLKKMISLLSSKYIKFTTNENTINLNCFNNPNDNSFNKDLPMETTGESISMKFSSEVFTLLPENNYTIEISKKGIFKILLVKDDIRFEVYVGEIED